MSLKSCLSLYLITTLSINISFGQNSPRSHEVVLNERESVEDNLDYTEVALENVNENNFIKQYDLLNIYIQQSQNLKSLLEEENTLLNVKLDSNRILLDSLALELDTKQNQYSEVLRLNYRQKLLKNDWLVLLSSESFQSIWRKFRYIRQFENFVRKEKDHLLEIQSHSKKTEQEIKEYLIEIKHNKRKLDLQLVKLEDEEIKLSAVVNQIKKEKQKSEKVLIEQEQYKNLSSEKILNQEIDQFSISSTHSSSKLDPNSIDNQRFASNKKKMPWPVENGFILEKFGERPHDVVPNVWIENNGIGIMTKSGENVKVVHGGVVKQTPRINDLGYMVIIEHGDYLTSYFTLASIFVKKGDRLSEGQIIGTISKSNTSTPMLHFEIWQGFEKLNPEHWLMNK